MVNAQQDMTSKCNDEVLQALAGIAGLMLRLAELAGWAIDSQRGEAKPQDQRWAVRQILHTFTPVSFGKLLHHKDEHSDPLFLVFIKIQNKRTEI